MIVKSITWILPLHSITYCMSLQKLVKNPSFWHYPAKWYIHFQINEKDKNQKAGFVFKANVTEALYIINAYSIWNEKSWILWQFIIRLFCLKNELPLPSSLAWAMALGRKSHFGYCWAYIPTEFTWKPYSTAYQVLWVSQFKKKTKQKPKQNTKHWLLISKPLAMKSKWNNFIV